MLEIVSSCSFPLKQYMFESTPLQCIVNLLKGDKDFNIWIVTIQLHQNLLMVLVVTFTNFFVLFREDRLYCDQCYKEQFVPRCAKCQDFITSVRIIIIISSVLDRTIHHYNDQIFFAISTFIMIISWLFQNSGLHPRHGPVLAPRVFCLLWLFCSGWRCWCLSQVADVDGWWHSLLEGSF